MCFLLAECGRTRLAGRHNLENILAAITAPFVIQAKSAANESAAIGSMRTVNTAQAAYQNSCGAGFYAPSFAHLASEGFAGWDLDVSPKSGFSYLMTPGAGGRPGQQDERDGQSDHQHELHEPAAGVSGVRETCGPPHQFFPAEHPAELEGDEGGEDAAVIRVATEAQRRRLVALRADGTIGDTSFQRVEEELDWAELDWEQLVRAGAAERRREG